MKRSIQVVCGAQFGSEAKGHIAAYLATYPTSLHAVRVAGPNAGHTVVDSIGQTWKLRQVPVAAVTNPNAELIIAAGSEINRDVLISEVESLDRAGFMVTERLHIHPSATMISSAHLNQEMSNRLSDKIGSTMSGVGAARASRIWRTAVTAANSADLQERFPKRIHEVGLNRCRRVLIEGTQGYGLGLHTSYYPFCTTSDCRAIDFLAMAGVSPWGADLEVWLVARTFPIRVAGNSGPLLNEIAWADLKVDPETTTVTQKVRRVGQWDSELVKKAVAANGGCVSNHVHLAITMLDYLEPKVRGRTSETLDLEGRKWVSTLALSVEERVGVRPTLFGTSPSTVIDWRDS